MAKNNVTKKNEVQKKLVEVQAEHPEIFLREFKRKILDEKFKLECSPFRLGDRYVSIFSYEVELQ